MSDLLAVDPGIRACGVAMFRGRTLYDAHWVRSPAEGNRAGACRAMALAICNWAVWSGPSGELAVEWPRTYGGHSARGDTNDLFALAGVDSALSIMLRDVPVASYLPDEWKGTMPKDVCAARVVSRLSEEERAVLARITGKAVPKSKMHNVFDAVGIGLHHLGRLGIRKELAR